MNWKRILIEIALFIPRLLRPKKEISKEDIYPSGKEVLRFTHDILEVEDHMRRKLDVFQADYISTNIFENGVKVITQSHKIKFSRTYEVRKDGHPRKKDLIQGYPLALFMDMWEKILNEHVIYYKSPNEYNPDPYKQEEVFQMGVKSVVFLLMVDDDGYPLGFMTFEFHKETNLRKKDLDGMVNFNKLITEKILQKRSL